MNNQLKYLRPLIYTLLILQGSYVVLGNLLLLPMIGHPIISLKPEKFYASWNWAWTLVPGVIHVDDLKIRAQTRRMQWYLTVDEGSLAIQLWDLPFKQFTATSIDGSGVEFFLRRRLPPGSQAADTTRIPDIPGLENPPKVAPETLYPPKTGSKAWVVRLENVKANLIRNVWLEKFHLTGTGSGNLQKMAIETRGGPMSLQQGRIKMTEAESKIGEYILADQLNMDLRLEIDPFRPRGAQWKDASSNFSGEIKLLGRSHNIEIFNILFKNHPFRFASTGKHSLSANLIIDDGRFLDNSKLTIDGEGLIVNYLHYEVRGKGTLGGSISQSAAGTTTNLTLTLNEFDFGYAGGDDFINGKNFQLSSSIDLLDIAANYKNAVIDITVPESNILNLSHYNTVLPKTMGLEIVSGTGKISSKVHLKTKENTLQGTVKLTSEDMLVTQGNLTINSAIDMETQFKLDGFDELDFNASGTRLRLENLSLQGDGTDISDWWGEIDIRDANLRFHPKIYFNGLIEMKLLDSKPIVAIFKQHRPLPKWVAKAVTDQHTQAVANVTLDDKKLLVDNFHMVGDKLNIEGKMEMKDKQMSALVYLRYRKLSAAAKRKYGQTDWKIVGARKWFEQNLSDEPVFDY